MSDETIRRQRIRTAAAMANPNLQKGPVMRSCALLLCLSMLLVSGCSMYGSTAIRTGDPVPDIATSGKALVLFDASSYQPGLLGGDKNILVYFTTRDAQPTIEDGKTHVRDTFSTFYLDAYAVPPGRYSLMDYNAQGFKINVNVGGWTNFGRPLTAGFTVRAGEVVYLGHLKAALSTATEDNPVTMLHLSIEDRRPEDDAEIHRILARYPGALERLQTRLLEIYMPDVPLKPNSR